MNTWIEKAAETRLVNKLDPAEYHPVAQDYLRYFDISEKGRPGLTKLAEILQAFINIPYENLSKIIKYHQYHQDLASLRMPDEVWEAYKRHRLGGTCFSLTFFLLVILDYLHYSCYPVMARMKAGPNHHCALVVEHGGEHYLVDPGYALDVPMPFLHRRERVFRTAHSGVEIRPGEVQAHYHVFTFNRQGSQWRYEFADVPTPPDRFLQHWLESFTWNGMHGLCLTKIQKDTLYFVHNYFMREANAAYKKNHNLKRNREEVIRSLFGIDPKIVQRAQEALEENLKREGILKTPRQ